MVRTIPLILALGASAASLPAQRATDDFAREVQPLLAARCFACHGPDAASRKGELRLDRREDALRVITTGVIEESELWRRVTHIDEAERMPPSEHGAHLAPSELALLRRWIEAGAPFAAHWAYEPPRRVPLPLFGDGRSPSDPLDAFVLARLEASGLEANGSADPRLLLRRASLDLTGLPPAPDDLARFAADPSVEAYAREVERLLASPRYAERWAAEWLDLARYADSAGFGSDPLRSIWRYRDWVIEAFERNTPYDQFTIEQLAGDLLPDATMEQKLATAFHRNTLTNTEGGTDDEEFRVAAVKDRASTTFQVWMGLTLGCAQCHSHKFDPLSQREFYQVYAFFDQSADHDRPDEEPRLETPTAAQAAALTQLQSELDALRAEIAAAEASAPPWQPLEVRSVEGTSGTRYELENGSGFRASGEVAQTERTTVRAQAPSGGLGVLRLILEPCEQTGAVSLSGPFGNAVLTDLRVAARRLDRALPRASRIRISLRGAQRILHLAEVEVFAHGENVARRGRARQSSTAFGGDAARAIDGGTSGVFDNCSCTHTETERDPWWELELEDGIEIERIAIWNRTDHELERRLDGARVEAFDAAGTAVWSSAIRVARADRFELEPASFAPIELAHARADFAQEGFGAAAAIDAEERTGWALSPRVRESHSLEVEVDAAHLEHGVHELEMALDQLYGARHVFARARLEHRAPPSAAVRALRAKERELESRLAALEISKTPVMQELPPQLRRTTRMLEKGSFLAPGEIVEPAVPAAFHAWPEDAPKNRLGLARWIVDPENPLTARVAVNRFWARLFGRGLVETEEDFGVQGSAPSHLEVLDLLALDFVASGWDVKALLRRLVSSEAYRRASDASAEHLARDPRNLYLARGPRFRLSAEMVRDQALEVAGLLSSKRFGPSVFPPQPEGLWQAAFNGERTWATSGGEDRHRRALYTFLRRTIPYPSLALFDAPSREICTARRFRTNTPLQALVTLNDPVFVEAAQGLARRVIDAPLADDASRAAYGFELCTAERASDAATSVLLDLLAARRAERPGDESAAWTSVTAVLLNLEAALVKR